MSSTKFLCRLPRKVIFQSLSLRTCTPAVRNFADWVPKEEVTHTGQKWESDDYRLARFIDKPKHVNPNFAIDLIAEVPPKPCKERVVSCDGGGGPIGHPKVYINLDKPGNHACGYCGLRFVKEDAH
ncbi:PREDICTED: NADH dehydrogenase [ubiquinone] iron-sulfur protein 6, mitochondrial [Nicrophorus vespilloides]|uniref:NADH dehydrogenase [ubiquinone] iron-sulfur protein 6, mitochondrial n=1 Tax=Nicrophorus vespilloides TaxID=110193 RepID=A0ABM1N2Z0_NICVS|nr:PREDICTED: NADH dehydrogenase [ubiquinone] iron-sulfur protein 6, mitochondrial [Nicrophorus vespilloides]